MFQTSHYLINLESKSENSPLLQNILNFCIHLKIQTCASETSGRILEEIITKFQNQPIVTPTVTPCQL